MAQPLTTDNADEVIKRVVRDDFSNIINRLKAIEDLVRRDLSLDRKQKDEIPDSESRLNSINSRVDRVRTEVNLLREDLKGIKEQLQLIATKVEEI